MNIPTRDEIIEDKLRHILGRLERMEKVGKKDYLQLDPVEATALAIVLKERVAEYTIQRYSTDREHEQVEMARQQRLLALHAQAQAIQPGQMVNVSGGGGVTKKAWWKP